MTQKGEDNDVVKILKKDTKITERWANSPAHPARRKHISKFEGGSLSPILVTEKLIICVIIQILTDCSTLKNNNKHQYKRNTM